MSDTKALIERLHAISNAIAAGDRSELTMRVPAESDRDADLVIATAARLLQSLTQQEPAQEPHDNKANVSEPHPMLSATHFCRDCRALWRQCDDFTFNLRSEKACPACDNAPVGGQLVSITTPMIRAINKLRQQMRAYRVLKTAVDAMMAPLGYHGTISARDDRAQAVMDALAQVDSKDRA